MLRRLCRLPLSNTRVTLGNRRTRGRFINYGYKVVSRLVSTLNGGSRTLLVSYHSLKAGTISVPGNITIIVVGDGFGHALINDRCGAHHRRYRANTHFFRRPTLHSIAVRRFGTITRRLSPVITGHIQRVLARGTHAIRTTDTLRRNSLGHVNRLVTRSRTSVHSSFRVAIPRVSALMRVIGTIVNSGNNMHVANNKFNNYVITLVPRRLIPTMRRTITRRCRTGANVGRAFCIYGPSRKTKRY